MTQSTPEHTRAGPKEGTARQASRAEYKARAADPRPLLTIQETADHLKVTPRTVYRLIDDGQLRSVSIALGEGRRARLRVRPIDLDTYVARLAS